MPYNLAPEKRLLINQVGVNKFGVRDIVTGVTARFACAPVHAAFHPLFNPHAERLLFQAANTGSKAVYTILTYRLCGGYAVKKQMP